MADRDSERDRRVRELLSDTKKKDQMAVMSQAQAEIGDIQSDLRNHLAMQQAQEQNRLQQAQTISQAAQGMMAMEGQDQLQGQVATMNPQTQATLGKFGVKPGRTQNTSRNQASNRVVTKTGDTTNIKNENITNNHTEIRVTQPSIPISQPTISVQPQQKREDNTSKFKAWLSGMFAKQQNEAEIQRKEYRKKEWNLGRTTTRLMKRIEEATSGLGARLDPKNMTSTLGGQLKWLLLIFGATMMSKFWKPTMKFLANLEGGFKAVFGLPMNQDLRQASSGTLSVIDQIKDFIGIKKGENETLIGGIGKVFMEGIDKLIDRLKFWFEDRASALRDITFPEMKTPDFGLLGPVLSPIMDGLTDTFKGLAQYLGDLITVAMGGSKGRVKAAARGVAKKAQAVFTDTTGKQTSAGDSGLVEGKGRTYMRDTDYDMFGNLKNNASSTQAMSRSLISMFNDKSGKAHTAEIGTGIGQLFDVAKRSGQVVIDPELLGYLGISPADVMGLQRNKQLRQERYRIIGVKPTTDAQRKEMGQYSGNINFWGAGLTGTGLGIWGGAKLGAALGAGASTLIAPGLGTTAGGVIGGIIGGAAGAFGGGLTGSAVGAGVDAATKYFTGRGLYPKLVKADSSERSADGSLGVPKMMWVLTKEGADLVAAKFTDGMTNKDMDNTNQEFYKKLQRIEERRKRANGVTGTLTQNLSTDDLRSKQAAYDSYQKELYDRFESNDPNSQNMKNYGHWNTTMNNLVNVASNIRNISASGIRSVGNWITSERLSGKQVTSRSNYLMNELIKEGLTKDQAAGVAANIMRESGFVTNSWGDKGTSVGIAQWHNDRVTKYNTEYGATGSLADASYEDQVKYLIWEAKKRGNLEAVKRATSAAEAVDIWERKFEKSADYDTERNATRKRYASQVLNSYNDSSGEIDVNALQTINTSMATFYKGSSPFELNGQTSGGTNTVAWIGDSHSELGLPSVVGKKIEAKFGCQFIWGAYHGFSAWSHLKNKSYENVHSEGINNLTNILNHHPGVVIVELGANDANGVDGSWSEGIPKLIDTIKEKGGKIVWITPFGYSVGSQNARKDAATLNITANRVRNYILSRSDISVIDAGGFVNFYSGQATPWDKFVGKDGLHWNREGYKLLGEWIGGVLTGVAFNPNFTSEDLEKQDGFFGAYSQNINNVLESLAGKIEGSNETTTIPSPFAGLTEEQKKVINSSIKRQTNNEALNILSWESLGAKTDDRGTYFQNGDIRTYVRTDSGHSGLFGLKKDDIDWVERVDENGKTSKNQLTDTEAELAKNAAVYSVDSLFSNYPEKTKGKGYYDYMTTKSGKPLGFFIGEFTDIESFKDPAPKDFKGKIRFWIYPTKDLKRWNMVGIGEKRECSKTFMTSNEKNAGVVYYGPIIYHKGAHWRRPGTQLEKHDWIDYQTICYYLNVMLTPKARIKAMELINTINTFGEITKKDGEFYDQSGKKLSSEDVQKAMNFGIINEKWVTGTSSVGTTFSYSTGKQVKTDYNNAVARGKEVKVENFNIDEYSKSLGIGVTVKDREAYYNSHKDLFRTIDGVLYGPQSLKWGTVDDSGKVSLYDDQNFKSIVTKEGKAGLRHNEEEVTNEDNKAVYKTKGYISREAMAKFLFQASSSSKNTTHKNKSVKSIIRRRAFYLNGANSAPLYIPYHAFINSDGSIMKFKVTPTQIQTALRKRGYDVDSVYFGDSETIETKDLNSLDKAIQAEVQRALKGKKAGFGFGDLKVSLHEGDNVLNTMDSRVIEQTQKFMKKGKKIKSVTPVKESGPKRHQLVTFEDDEQEKVEEFIFLGDTQKWIREFNSAVDFRNKQLQKQAAEDAFKSSGMDKLYKSYADDANSGKLQYMSVGDKYVATTGGDIFGYKDQKTGKIVAISGEKAYDAAFSYFNRESTRGDFLTNILGLKNDKGKKYYQTKDSDGNLIRTQIDTSKDLSNFMSSGIDKLTLGHAQKYVDGKGWVDLSEEDEKNAFKALKVPVNQMVKNSDFTNKLIKALATSQDSSAKVAAKMRATQLNAAVDQKTQQKTANEYLKTIAEKTFGVNAEELGRIINGIKTEGDIEKKFNTAYTELADKLVSEGKSPADYQIYTTNIKGIRKLSFRPSVLAANSNLDLDTNKDDKLSMEEARGAKKIQGYGENGQPIEFIYSGGNYYVYTSNTKTFTKFDPIATGMTVSGFQEN